MLTLYHIEACPYCEKVRFALDHLGLEWTEVRIDPANRRDVVDVSGQPLVPVLVDGDRVIADSTRILDYIAENHDASLQPSDRRELGLSALLEDWADEVLAPAARRWLAGEAPEATVDDFLESLDSFLYGRTYLVGQGLSHADLAAFAVLAGLPEGERARLMEPYPNLRDWYLSLADFRDKSRSRTGGYIGEE